MLSFINGETNKAEFSINHRKVILYKGDERKGFMHILLRHYRSGDLEAMDILNISDIAERGLQLANEGVSNDDFIVYMSLKNGKELRLVLIPKKNGELVVSMYRKGS